MKIVSIHVPKAGGTSTLELWKQAFGESQVLMDYADPPGNPSANYIIDPVGWSAQRPKSLPDSIRVVHGHFRPHKYDLVKDVFRLTILRHPVDNLISIYRYWKIIPPQPNAVHQYFLANKLDVLGLARLPIIQRLYSDTYFGGWDMGRLDFVGKHDSRADDLARLASVLDLKCNLSVHLNATTPEGKDSEREIIMSDATTLKRLNNLLVDDIRFYERHVR